MTLFAAVWSFGSSGLSLLLQVSNVVVLVSSVGLWASSAVSCVLVLVSRVGL